MEVMRASHCHHVPHVGLPQKAPVTRDIAVNIVPVIAIDDPRRADRACAVLTLTGVVNIPIIYFSVQWWNTLHQGATIRLLQKPTIRGSMLAALLIMLAACWLYSVAVVLIRLRCIILEREQNASRFAEVGV